MKIAPVFYMKKNACNFIKKGIECLAFTLLNSCKEPSTDGETFPVSFLLFFFKEKGSRFCVSFQKILLAKS